jgi:hypothetical protein
MTLWPVAFWFLRSAKASSCFQARRRVLRVASPHLPPAPPFGGTALLLVSIPKLFALPIRFLGIVSAVLFIATAARIFWGEQLLPTSAPLPTYAYPVLVATFVGWIWTLWREADGK